MEKNKIVAYLRRIKRQRKNDLKKGTYGLGVLTNELLTILKTNMTFQCYETFEKALKVWDLTQLIKVVKKFGFNATIDGIDSGRWLVCNPIQSDAYEMCIKKDIEGSRTSLIYGDVKKPTFLRSDEMTDVSLSDNNLKVGQTIFFFPHCGGIKTVLK